MNNATQASQFAADIFSATRKFNGLLQSEFASVVESSQATISKIESGSMSVELELWFNLLRKFKIIDPYCFMYGGLEFKKECFEILKVNPSNLAPRFDFQKNEWVTTVKKIRPVFDYLKTKNKKTLKKFLTENKVKEEIFTILNHPLTQEFVDEFFLCLDDKKLNAKSVALLDFDFNHSFGLEKESLLTTKIDDGFYKIINNSADDFFSYQIGKSSSEYIVSVSKKNLSKLKSNSEDDLYLGYNLLYPFLAMKSMKSMNISAPKISALKDGTSWSVSYAGM
jgi:DNA-binding XRE family transcriptional regulator